MKSAPAPRQRSTVTGLLARAAVSLYPPAWRARYGQEILALLSDSGGSLGAVMGVAWRALPAWAWPPGHLHDSWARMRSSLATAAVAWSLLAGLGLVFAQLTQLQDFRPHGHPLIGWSYTVFDAALAVSALAAVMGGLPLWLVMLRRARREHSPRDLAYLLLPVAAPVIYLAALVTGLKMIRGSGGIGPWWFAVFAGLGFAAAGGAAAGPGVALRRLQPRGPAVRWATFAAAVAVITMLAAATASGIAGTGLYLWARDFAGYHDAPLLAGYVALLSAAGTVALVTTIRGRRAAA